MGECCGIAAVGFDAVAGLFGDERGCDDPAGELLACQIAIQPVAAGTGLVDEDQLREFGPEFADEFVDVALACADAAQ